MEKNEVALLFLTIQENYPDFDISDANVERHFEKLKDFPYAVAKANVEEYILTNLYRKAPSIPDIRGGLGSRKELEESRKAGKEFLKYLEEIQKTAVLPPEKVREKIRELKRSIKHDKL
ncbi:hypothetical protein [Paenibacillus woosongensis]|uniref:Replicative helicase inhibitor G39P N-terminal domain-containing protein n=1 Tax=Paenibacillus woosongensis TaxID=307580 RepID=A0ABQ4MYZ5_9BACL|nr:hypothetical protein [Paenibacillus woosongensis]GIP61152.1 hypothetical protein J15TS10_49660 [Paenibacillus woosongensis]